MLAMLEIGIGCNIKALRQHTKPPRYFNSRAVPLTYSVAPLGSRNRSTPALRKTRKVPNESPYQKTYAKGLHC